MSEKKKMNTVAIEELRMIRELLHRLLISTGKPQLQISEDKLKRMAADFAAEQLKRS